MKKMKTLLALLLVLVMVAGCFAGCAPKDEYPVVTWYLMSSANNTRDLEAVSEAANKIFREKLGLEVKFYFLEGTNFAEKMNVMMNSGEELDIMAGGSYAGTAFETAFRTGALLALDDLLEKYGSDIMKKNDERVWESVTRGGKIYAIPSQMPWANGNVLSWRKDLVDKYDIDIDSVKTMEDLEPILAMIKEKEPDVIPFYGINVPDAPVEDFASSAHVGVGSPIVDDLITYNYESGKFESWFQQEEVIEVYEQAHDFYKKGYSPADALARNEAGTEYKSGDYFCFSVTSEFTGGSKSTGIVGYDCYESLLSYEEITTGAMNMVCTYISATSKQPENAMKVINLVWSDPALLNLLAYGIEGTNYTVTGTDHNGNPSVEPKSGDEQRWAVFHNFWGPLWDQWDSPWNSTEALEAMQDANINSPCSKLLGFSFDQEPVKTQMAELLAIQAEVLPVLETGTMEDFDAYVKDVNARLEKAGIKDVIAEAERQYNEWLKVK